MTKVHPGAAIPGRGEEKAAPITSDAAPAPAAPAPAAVLTVWKKSLLLSCDGFTAFDGRGDIAFRVDSYRAGGRGRIVLMDAAGKALLTIRRKRMSLGERWGVYEGEAIANPRFIVRKRGRLLRRRKASIAECVGGGEDGGVVRYEVEGSYARRSCAVCDGRGRVAAEIKPKDEVLGADVFRLVVRPHMDAALAMTLVILLDRMFPSRSRRFPARLL